jgi:ribonuclease HI
MTRVDSFTHLLTRCIVATNDGLIVLEPFLMVNLFIYLQDNPYIQWLIRLFKVILLAFVSFLVIIASMSYGSVRTKQTHMRDASSAPAKNESIAVLEQEQHEVTIVPPVSEVTAENKIIEIHELPSEVITSKDCSHDQKIFRKSLRQLICYCDGSYSCETRIGYSGFRTSNGFSKYLRCPLRRPYGGSTESEVFAACLVLQYTAKYQYDTLILYTDNLKVEQLLTKPKKKDLDDYPTFFKALQQCHERSKQFHIRVEHVRGHPTWYEQQQCPIKREFAKVDRQVRQRRQQYEYIYNFPNKINDQSHMTHSYRCGGRYIRLIHPKKFGATLIISTDH